MADESASTDEIYPATISEGKIGDLALKEQEALYRKKYNYKFTMTWMQIRNRLHENSGLHNPMNSVGILFDLTLGTFLEAFDDFIDEHVLQGFILTSSQAHLDRIADEYGLKREEYETDDELRQRIFNKIVLTMSIVFLDRQGLRCYSKCAIDDDSRIHMTSMNPHTNNIYDTIPVTEQAKSFLFRQFLYDYTANPHWKGW